MINTLLPLLTSGIKGMSVVKMVVLPDPAGADTPMEVSLSLTRACKTASIASAWKSRSLKLSLMVTTGLIGSARISLSRSRSLVLDDAWELTGERTFQRVLGPIASVCW